MPSTASTKEIALSTDAATLLWATSSATVYRTTNKGTSWTQSSGLTFNAIPVADAVNASKFYSYNASSGAFFMSSNGGASFAQVSVPGNGGNSRARAVPGVEGDVWVALYNGGLTRTTNSGTSFSKLSSVSACAQVGFGKAAVGKTYPAVYIWGTVNGVTGIFRSDDIGATWTRINDNQHQFGGLGNAQLIDGDMNVYGRVYTSSVGRGVLYGTLLATSSSSAAVSSSSSKPSSSSSMVLSSSSVAVSSSSSKPSSSSSMVLSSSSVAVSSSSSKPSSSSSMVLSSSSVAVISSSSKPSSSSSVVVSSSSAPTSTTNVLSSSSAGSGICANPVAFSGGTEQVSPQGVCLKINASGDRYGLLASISNAGIANTQITWFGGSDQNISTCVEGQKALTGNGAQLDNFVVGKDAQGYTYIFLKSLDTQVYSVNVSLQNWQNGTGCTNGVKALQRRAVTYSSAGLKQSFRVNGTQLGNHVGSGAVLKQNQDGSAQMSFSTK